MIWLIIAAVAVVLIIRALLPIVYAAKAGKAYAENNIAKAVEYYKVAAASGKTEHKLNYALMLMRSGDFRTAEAVFNGIVLDGAVPANDKLRAKLYRCMLYEKTDRLDDALEDAEEAFERMKNTAAYGVLGHLRQKKGGAELDFCLEAYDYNSDDRDICDNLVIAYVRSGELEKAKELASEIREKFPTFLEGFYRSAVIADMMGDKAAAKKFLDETENCSRNLLTTVSEEEIEQFRKEIENA